MIHLHSLGQCMITLASTRLLPASRLAFASALFVAVEGTRSIARERMAALFWPDLTEEKAAHALRQNLYRLRNYGMPLDGDAKEVVLPAGSVHRDYDALLSAEVDGRGDGLLERIPGGFLPGYMPTISAPFAEWVDGQRTRVNASLRRQLVAGIGAQRSAGNWPAAQALAQRCLEIDPLNEEATLAYAEAIAMDGSKALAIMQIDRYLTEIGPRAKELHLPATLLRRRISELYPLPPVIERDPPHTGRDAEMGRLDAAMLEVRQGHGCAFLISGPPGIGKTRLATEFTRAAQLQGMRVARTGMGRHDDHRPLGAWCDLVREMRRMPGAAGCDPHAIPFLERLTSGASAAGAAPEEEQSAAELFSRIRAAILDLVGAVATESVLILWIEDVHWMDEWSWDVMSELTRELRGTGVMVLMTRRESDEPGTPVPAEARVERMEMGPLDDARCRRLLALVDARPKRTDEEFADWCVRTCAGNPYFLIELVRRASRSDGRFLAPPSLTRLIAQRFEEVSPLSRRVLQAAAVLGRNSTLRRIEHVLGERRVDLLASLDELTAHALLVTEQERVVCRHDLLGMSALSGVSELSLKLLHQHSGAVLEKEIDEESTPDFLSDCAEHWEKAGEVDRALELVKGCAMRAIEIGAPAEAVRVLELALKWRLQTDSANELRTILVRALHLARDDHGVVRVAEELRRSRAALGASAPPLAEEALCELDAELFATTPNDNLLMRAVACALAKDATPDFRVEAAVISSKIASDLYRPWEARAVFDEVREIAKIADRALVCELQVVFEGSFGSASSCGAAASELRQLADDPRNSSRRLVSLQLASLGLFVAGNVEEALECALENIRISDSLQTTTAQQVALQGLARLHLMLGDVDAARPVISRLTQSEFRSTQGRGESRSEYPARLALLEGDDESAQPMVEDHFKQWSSGWARKNVHRTAMLALPRLRRGQWSPDDAEMNELLTLHREGRAHGTHDFFVYMLSFAFAVREDSGSFTTLYSEYLERYRREKAPVLRQLRERV